MASGIYQIVCTANEKAYVGSAVDIRRRWNYHRERLRKGNHDNERLQHAWDKYGEAAFAFSVLETCEVPELIGREQALLDGGKFAFNMASAATSPMLGRKHSAEACAKMSAAQKGHPFYGPFTITEETRAKQSAARIGMRHTPESIAKMSVIQRLAFANGKKRPLGNTHNLGRKHTAEAKANMSRSKLGTHSRLGIPHTEEQRNKIRDGMLRHHARRRAEMP
jgi:group I intron endonuclease